MKKIVSISLCLVLLFQASGIMGPTNNDRVNASSEVNGLWVAYCDFKALGLYNRNESDFRAKTRSLLGKAKTYGTNTIYFHVRAFDDASWKSSTFKPSKYLTSKKSFSYDPLQIFIEESHRAGMELHAWMNPYRINSETYLNPGASSSTTRIVKAIDEVLKYDVDGIHFDDYFYHATKYYKNVLTGSKIKASSKPSASIRRTNCNTMVKAAYTATHKKSGVVFGISPAGNVENCMSGGADVKTWMSKSGYIDYIAPQIYWTDNWGSSGNTRMFSDRLAQWKSLNKLKKTMYIGLALYRTGQNASDDKGWGRRNTNIRTQVKKLRSSGMKGYILFTAPDLYDSHAKSELYYLKGLVKPIKATSIRFTKKKRTVYLKTRPTYKVKFNPTSTNPKRVSYKSSKKKVVGVTSSGKIVPKKRGVATITATTSNGKTATMVVRVKKFKKFKARVTKSRVNVRRKASAGSKKMGILKKGKKVTIRKISKNGQWGMYKKNRWIKLSYTNIG